MWRFIKQLVLGLLLGLFLLMAFVFGYFYFNQDKIVQLVVDEVNRNVNAQIDVHDVSMSFWERFPLASIKFQDVTIHNAKSFGQKTAQNLLVTEYLYFDLDLKTLISDKPQIRRLSVGPGELNLLVDKQNKPNYFIAKSDESGGGEFELGNLEIKGLKVNYTDFGSGIKQTFDVKSADISAIIGEEEKLFDVNVSIENPTFVPVKYIFFEDYGFVGHITLTNENIMNWYGIVNFDGVEIENKGSYAIGTSSLALEVSPFLVDDDLAIKLFKSIDIPIKPNKLSLNVNKLLLQASSQSVYLNASYLLDGSFDINKEFNSIDLNNKGIIVWDNNNLQINVQKLNASYANSNLGFVGEFNSRNTNISGKLNFHVELNDFEEYLNQYKIENPKGILDGNFQIENHNTLNNKNFNIRKGEVGLTNLALNLTDNHLNIEDVQSLLYFSDDEIIVEELKGIINKNDVEFNGTTKGLQQYLFSGGVLSISGDVFSNEFYLSDFLYASPESKSGTIKLGEKLNMDMDVIVKDLRNNNFIGSNLSLKLDKKGHKLNFKNFDINTSGGHLSGNGVFLEQDNGEWYTTISANIDQIEIGTFFAQMNDFGQNYIVSDNLKGQLTASISSDFVFNPQFKVKTESIYLDADVEVVDGELINYKALEELSDFISVDELNHIKFNTLKNRISIHDNKIVIPQMQIQSSAIDIGVVGEHYFNDNIDYQISVGLTDVLFGKIPRKLRKDSKRRKNKKLTLFVDITGNINDPKISLSKISREKVIDTEKETNTKKKFDIEFDDI
ncbi:MAG: hypothetical protein C0599_02805 [Salinivirgaceae bacterium]|nr:MAG: hypothetical protein C0599_02805 [Salinivirgaceae bacterium]